MGKISIKYYLNKNVKPQIQKFDVGENDKKYFEEVELYPLYYYITTRRKTIHKPSRISLYVSERNLKYRIHWMYGEHFGDIMDYEAYLITKIVELFDKDYTEGNVKTAFQRITNKSFNSKDDYTNNLNAYIEFYMEAVRDLATREADEVTELLFKSKERELRKKLGKFSHMVKLTPLTINTDRMLETYEQAFGSSFVTEIYAKYIIQLFMQNVHSLVGMPTAQAMRKIGLTVYEWVFGNGKELVWENLEGERKIKNKNVRDTNLPRCLTMTRKEYDNEIVPIIDRVCSVEDRIEKAYQAMKRGI